MRFRQGAALPVLRGERRRASQVRQAAGGGGPVRDRQARVDRRQRRGKWRTRAEIVGRGGARARAGACLRRSLPLALHRRHRYRRPDDRARWPPDDARRRGRAERSRDAHRGSSRCGRRFHARDCQRRRDERAYRAQRRDRRRLRRHCSSGARSPIPPATACPKPIPPRDTTSRSRAARRSSASSIPCRTARGSACT